MAQSNTAGVQGTSLVLHGGYYEVSVGRLPCTAMALVTVLPGIDRTIMLKGDDRLDLTEGLASIAGRIPEGDLLVSAECLDSTNQEAHYVGVIENGAYYFDEIQGPATCTLSVYPPGVFRRFLIKIPGLAVGGSVASRMRIEDITWAMLAPGERARTKTSRARITAKSFCIAALR